ncbi:MAG TPA: alpha/beta fold hydrolase [Blastocatellia bacterium]|nr:alpha/beta fold hydrolase [Blastocatellia bacterium]HMV82205.1 alpha/beta fold hydrolase [Blastocatellia bacterium]HMZ20360.1 alpha/beta fold hydrolase [Blastocatellia bacterium]HNG32051.1 alpha/beta fold hydrolase [Blastocatellia bacterium]
MSAQSLSLFHQTAPPKSGLSGKPPLLLLLHGYGANEDDLFSLAPYLDERFLVVSARAPISLRGMGYAWFNLGFTPQGIAVDSEEIEAARLLLRKFIAEAVEAYDCDPNAVYLAGFSQGAMMSLAVALTFPGVAAAAVAMSGRLLPQTVAQITDKDALIGLPVFVVHGTRDAVVPISHGRDTKARLADLPIDLTYREYEMGHEVSVESLEDVTEWLKERLDTAAAGTLIN